MINLSEFLISILVICYLLAAARTMQANYVQNKLDHKDTLWPEWIIWFFTWPIQIAWDFYKTAVASREQ